MKPRHRAGIFWSDERPKMAELKSPVSAHERLLL